MLARAVRVVIGQRGAPTATADLARRLVECGAPARTCHAPNPGDTMRHGRATAAFENARVPGTLAPATRADFPTPAPGPAYSVLDCSGTYAITGPARHWRYALTAQLKKGL